MEQFIHNISTYGTMWSEVKKTTNVTLNPLLSLRGRENMLTFLCFLSTCVISFHDSQPSSKISEKQWNYSVLFLLFIPWHSSPCLFFLLVDLFPFVLQHVVKKLVTVYGHTHWLTINVKWNKMWNMTNKKRYKKCSKLVTIAGIDNINNIIPLFNILCKSPCKFK